ncbi:MAG: hypothetical protein IT426_19615 [Pirellulales bacterium]|nr:hypothetical protein [Pirellulales bacterium]
MIRKDFREGIGYSVVEFDGARQIFAAARPRRGANFAEQAEETLQSLDAIYHQEGFVGSIVMQTVFLDDLRALPDCRRRIREFYAKNLPATAYLAQPPCAGYHLAIEAWGIAGGKNELHIERRGEEMTLVRHRGNTWAYLANVLPATAAEAVYDRSLSAFHSAGERLHGVGLRFGDVLRTWLYLGNITAPDGQTSRYLELNRARTDYYRNVDFADGRVPGEWNRPVFPASTGIGTQDNEVAIGCLALQSARPGTVLVPLENPRQTAACDYAHQYGPESPKFARAMAVASGDAVCTFISGTASITASDTRHADDFERQTQQTIDNIEVLIAPDNFRRHGFPGMGAALDDLALARVYIKRPEDFERARAICRKRWGELPTIYVVADVCRDELLVEIEALAFSPRQDP